MHLALTEGLNGDHEMRRLNDAIEVAFEVTGQRPDFALLNLFLGRKVGLVRQDGVTLRLAPEDPSRPHTLRSHLYGMGQ